MKDVQNIEFIPVFMTLISTIYHQYFTSYDLPDRQTDGQIDSIIPMYNKEKNTTPNQKLSQERILLKIKSKIKR